MRAVFSAPFRELENTTAYPHRPNVFEYRLRKGDSAFDRPAFGSFSADLIRPRHGTPGGKMNALHWIAYLRKKKQSAVPTPGGNPNRGSVPDHRQLSAIDHHICFESEVFYLLFPVKPPGKPFAPYQTLEGLIAGIAGADQMDEGTWLIFGVSPRVIAMVNLEATSLAQTDL